MMMDLEKIIDEIATRLSRGRDITFWQNNQQLSPIVNLLHKLSNFPKSQIPQGNLDRVKNQIFDRISAPAEKVVAEPVGFFASFPSYFKFASGVVGTLLIVISLGIGTAVAALQSVPGQPIYPLKKIVENIELQLTRDPAAKANLQIEFANNRLEELATVLEKSEAGEISSAEVQQIVARTVTELEQTTTAALKASKTNPTPSSKQVSTLNKLVNLSNKQTAVLTPLLSAANITNDGQVKIVVEQALENSKVSKEEAIKNIENAGLKVEEQPLSIPEETPNKVSANGKVTAIASDSITIGTAKFLVTKDTKYDNISHTEIKVGTLVNISGETKDDKTFASTITLAKEQPKPETETNNTPTETQPDSENSDQP